MNKRKRARWMVVDDDKEVLDATSWLMGAVSNAEIWPFLSPWRALDFFATAPETFQLVVTDFEMKGMNGVDLRRHMQALAPSLRVLLMSGNGTFTVKTALQNGFSGMLQKPFSLDELKLAIEFSRIRTQPFSEAEGLIGN